MDRSRLLVRVGWVFGSIAVGYLAQCDLLQASLVENSSRRESIGAFRIETYQSYHVTVRP